MQIYLPSTNNKWQNGWDTVGYNQTWSSEPIDSLTWLVPVCGKIGNLRIGELDARSLSLPEMCLYKKLYKKFKLRVQAHYTIFQVFAKHNYLLSWWKDGRNFDRSQEVYALEFNLLYLELALEKSCLSKFILESHPLIKLFTFQIELKKWVEHLVILSQSLSRKWRCFASILWMLTFERLLENVQRRRGSEGLENLK